MAAATATLSILNSFELSSNTGKVIEESQGDFADPSSEPLELSVSAVPFSSAPAIAGTCHHMPFTLATATVLKVWDDDTHKPSDFDYLHVICDEDFYVQVVGSATNFTIKCMAFVPWTMTYDQVLAAANTTDITGGTEPTMEDIDHINIGNYTGNTLDGVFTVID